MDHRIYDKISSSHKAFTISISSAYEPPFYHQAFKFSHWSNAKQSEIHALEANDTWTITKLHLEKHVITANGLIKLYLKPMALEKCLKLDLFCKGIYSPRRIILLRAIFSGGYDDCNEMSFNYSSYPNWHLFN